MGRMDPIGLGAYILVEVLVSMLQAGNYGHGGQVSA